MHTIDAVIVPSARPGASSSAEIVTENLGVTLLTVRGQTTAGARNMGLKAARSLGWRRVLFLDDDIIISSGQVTAAVKLLDDVQAAAFRAEDFPDNSVVRHAERAGGRQVPVYSGGVALLLDVCSVPRSRWFPEIYNEDWLFLHGLSVADAGVVTQLPYDPFMPGRAMREELGDLIAEAVRLHGEVGTDLMSWKQRIAERRELLDDVLCLPLPSPARRSVREAQATLDTFTPERVAATWAAVKM